MAYKYLNFAFESQEIVNEVIYQLENNLGLDCSDYELARMGERLGLKPNKVLLNPFNFLEQTITEIAEDAGYQVVNLEVNENGLHIEIEENLEDEDEE